MFEKSKKVEEENKILNRRNMLKISAGALIGGVIGARGGTENKIEPSRDEVPRELSNNELVDEYHALTKRFETIETATWNNLENTLQSLAGNTTASADELKPFATAVHDVNTRIETSNKLLATIAEHFRSSEFEAIPPLHRKLEGEIDALEPMIATVEASPLYTLYA